MFKVFIKMTAIAMALLCMGCNETIDSEESFYKWLGEPGNGFVKIASSNGFLLTMKYMPPEYLAYMEYKKGHDNRSWDMFFNEFNNSNTLLFTIEHEQTGADVSAYNVQSIPEYQKRIQQLSFDIKNHLFLMEGKGKKIKPVLATFENSFEVAGKKSFYVVFPKPSMTDSSNATMDIVFDDPFFDTGISHFVFDCDQINQLPNLQFIN